jgi:hypothetical protein
MTKDSGSSCDCGIFPFTAALVNSYWAPSHALPSLIPFHSFSVTKKGRMAECGHRKAHRLHWMHLELSHLGTSAETLLRKKEAAKG